MTTGYADIFSTPNSRWHQNLGDKVDRLQELETHTGIANRAELLEFCKRVRDIGGGSPLEALLPGQTGVSDSCLIARNLNFDCRVAPYPNSIPTNGTHNPISIDPNDVIKTRQIYIKDEQFVFTEEQWMMAVEDRLVAKRIAKQLHLKVALDCDCNAVILLPKEIGNAAMAFDKYWAFQELSKPHKVF